MITWKWRIWKIPWLRHSGYRILTEPIVIVYSIRCTLVHLSIVIKLLASVYSMSSWYTILWAVFLWILWETKVRKAFSLLRDVIIVRLRLIYGSKIKLDTCHFLVLDRHIGLTTEAIRRLARLARVLLNAPPALITGLAIYFVFCVDFIARFSFNRCYRVLIAGEIFSRNEYTLTRMLTTDLSRGLISASLTLGLALWPWNSFFG